MNRRRGNRAGDGIRRRFEHPATRERRGSKKGYLVQLPACIDVKAIRTARPQARRCRSAQRCFDPAPVPVTCRPLCRVDSRCLRQSEVEDRRDARLRNHDVRSLEIPMHDASLMRMRNRVGNLEPSISPMGCTQAPRPRPRHEACRHGGGFSAGRGARLVQQPHSPGRVVRGGR